MRPLKFRAWDNVKKEWLLGYELPNLGGFSLYGECMAFGEWQHILSGILNREFGEFGSELKVMQFTGICDDTGKEIYEGDVMDMGNSIRRINNHAVVEYIDSGFYLVECDDGYVWDLSNRVSHPGTDANTGETLRGAYIVGNIYENPDLLSH